MTRTPGRQGDPLCVNVINIRSRRRLLFKQRKPSRWWTASPRTLLSGSGEPVVCRINGGERAGVVNPDFDKRFLDNLVSDPMANASLTQRFRREAGSEGIEIMWNVMRRA